MALTSSIISEFPQLYRKVTVQLSRRFRLESEVPSTAIPAVVVIFALGLLWTTFTFLSGQKLKSIPILDAGPGNLRQRKDVYTFKARELLRAGYQKYKDQVYGVETNDGVKLILPRKYLGELKSSPDISFSASLNKDLLKDYTFLQAVPELAIHIVKSKLNPHLTQLTPVLHGIIKENFAALLPTSSDWTPVLFYENIVNVVATASARLFAGEEASRDRNWVENGIAFTNDAVNYAQALKMWPPVLRPFVYRFVPGYRTVQKQLKACRVIVQKNVLRYKREVADGTFDETLGNMISWIHQEAPPQLANDLSFHFRTQMALTIASLHTTSTTTTQCLYDLAAHPELIPVLRAEVKEHLAANNGEGFTRPMLNKLWKLDSFMKESQRWSSPDLTTFQRRSVRSFTLSDGLRIPANTKLEMATAAVYQDPEVVPNPASWDALRYYNQRKSLDEQNSGPTAKSAPTSMENNQAKHQFVTVTKESLSFGFGKHACPGRFLADIEVKLMLCEILLNYDLKNPDGQKERHANVEFENLVFPDASKSILLRRISARK